MDLNALFQTLGITGIVAGAAAWVLRKFINKQFEKDLEKYKFGLEKASTEHRIKFEKLHAERGEVIKNVYQGLSKAEIRLRSLVKPLKSASEPDDDTKRQQVAESYKHLVEYFETNKIFLDEPTADLLQEFIDKSWDIFVEFQLAMDLEREGDLKGRTNSIMKAWELYEKDLPPIKKNIEEQFRKLVGIEKA